MGLSALLAPLAAAPSAGAVVDGRLAERDGVPVVAVWAGDGGAPRPSRPVCSGVLVAPDRVLTAAHCVAERGVLSVQPHELRVAVGRRDVARIGRSPARRGNAVRGVVVHERAVRGAPRGEIDLAVLLLARRSRVAPLRPATVRAARPAVRVGAGVRVSGFGATHPGGASVLRRRTADGRVLDPRGVTRRSAGAGLRDLLPLVGRGGGGPACVGDSGAPVLSRGGRLVGLVSGGAAAGDCRRVGTLAQRLGDRRGWLLGDAGAAPTPERPPVVTGDRRSGGTLRCELRVPPVTRWEAFWEDELASGRADRGGTSRARGTATATGSARADRTPGSTDVVIRRTLGTDDRGGTVRCVVELRDAAGRRSVSRSRPVRVR